MISNAVTVVLMDTEKVRKGTSNGSHLPKQKHIYLTSKPGVLKYRAILPPPSYPSENYIMANN